MQQRFENFAEFYRFYLDEHRHPINRRLHMAGLAAGLAALAAFFITWNGWWLAAALVVGYGLSWIGHFAFERNRPAAFRHPLYSLRGDLTMLKDVFTGKIKL